MSRPSFGFVSEFGSGPRPLRASSAAAVAAIITPRALGESFSDETNIRHHRESLRGATGKIKFLAHLTVRRCAQINTNTRLKIYDETTQ